MQLLGRVTRPGDFDQCTAFVRDRFLYDDDELVDLRNMWRDVLARDVGRSAVVFEAGRPDRVLAFGVSAAIDAVRFEALLSARAPFIGKTLLADWRSGNDPFLDEPSFANANASEGLDVIVMHNGVDESLDPALIPAALSSMSENFVTQHQGSNLKTVVHESFGIPAEFAVDLGLRIEPYASNHEHDLERVPADRKPLITIMTRDDARKRPGNLVMYQTFLRFTPPQCDLPIAERRLLRYALEGTPDDALGEILEIAPSTLKKRWANVYAAMERVTGIAPGGDGGRRGAEVRRHVLRYLRQHPEELHAYSA